MNSVSPVLATSPVNPKPACDSRFEAWSKRQCGTPAVTSTMAFAGVDQIVTIKVEQAPQVGARGRVTDFLSSLHNEDSDSLEAELNTRHASGVTSTIEWGSDTVEGVTLDTEYTMIELIEAGREAWSKPPKKGKPGEVEGASDSETQDSADDNADELDLPVFVPSAEPVAGSEEDSEEPGSSAD